MAAPGPADLSARLRPPARPAPPPPFRAGAFRGGGVAGVGGGRGGTYSLRGPRGPGKPTIGPMAPAAAAATAAGTSHGVTMRRGESRPRPAPTLGLSQTRSWAGVPAAGQMCQAPPGHGDGCRNGRAGGKRRGAARPAPATEDLTPPPPPMAPPTPARPAHLSGTRGKFGGGLGCQGTPVCVCRW